MVCLVWGLFMIALGTHRGCLTTEAEMRAILNRCPRCGEDMGRKGYCTDEREKTGMEYFDRVRAEVLKEKK
jgi:hypothetical protein